MYINNRGMTYNYTYKSLDQMKQLKKVATDKGLTIRELISQAIEYYLEEYARGNIK